MISGQADVQHQRSNTLHLSGIVFSLCYFKVHASLICVHEFCKKETGRLKAVLRKRDMRSSTNVNTPSAKSWYMGRAFQDNLALSWESVSITDDDGILKANGPLDLYQLADVADAVHMHGVINLDKYLDNLGLGDFSYKKSLLPYMNQILDQLPIIGMKV